MSLTEKMQNCFLKLTVSFLQPAKETVRCNGTVTLHGNVTGIGTRDGAGTIGNNSLMSPSPYQNSVTIYITFCTFHLILVPVTGLPVPVAFPCSVTKP